MAAVGCPGEGIFVPSVTPPEPVETLGTSCSVCSTRRHSSIFLSSDSRRRVRSPLRLAKETNTHGDERSRGRRATTRGPFHPLASRVSQPPAAPHPFSRPCVPRYFSRRRGHRCVLPTPCSSVRSALTECAVLERTIPANRGVRV